VGNQGNPALEIAQMATDGYLISRGSAHAHAHLWRFLPISISRQENLNACGDKSGCIAQGYDNLILIGSHLSNRYTEMYSEKLNERFILPYNIFKNDAEDIIQIREGNQVLYTPTIVDGRGKDYEAPDRHVIILAAANMVGVQAAAHAITDGEILSKVMREIGVKENFTFLIYTDVDRFEKSGSPHLIQNTIRSLHPRS
jgi:hypothetical protein